MSEKKTVTVKLVRSPIGTRADHRATVRGLGLRRMHRRPGRHACCARHDQQGPLPGCGALSIAAFGKHHGTQ